MRLWACIAIRGSDNEKTEKRRERGQTGSRKKKYGASQAKGKLVRRREPVSQKRERKRVREGGKIIVKKMESKDIVVDWFDEYLNDASGWKSFRRQTSARMEHR